MSADVTKAPWHARPLPRSSSAIRRKKHRNFAVAKKNLRDRSYRVLHSLTAIKLFPKQKEATVLTNKIRHTNLHYFLDSFTAIFTTNSLVICKRSCSYMIRQSSNMNWAGRSRDRTPVGDFPNPSRPDFGSTQLPVQWAPGLSHA